MARTVMVLILGLGCSLAVASPSLRGQERRLPDVPALKAQAQVPAEEPAEAAAAAAEAQAPDFHQADSPSQEEMPTTTALDMAGLSANATEPAPALAANPAWEGKYADPRHVGCEREIKANGLSLTISGTEGTPGPGCGAGDTETSWAIPASIKSQESPDIVIDFSQKGGPKDLPAKWDGDGIKFADGNKWMKLSANATEATAQVSLGAASCGDDNMPCWRSDECCSGRCKWCTRGTQSGRHPGRCTPPSV